MESQEQKAAPEQAGAPQKRAASGIGWRVLAGVLVVAALGASGWVAYDSRQRLGATQEELARRLKGIDEDAREARAAAREAQESAREMQAKLRGPEAAGRGAA